MPKYEYTDQERAEYLELAKEIGLTRAKRQLGFPKSWATAKKWADAAGIEVPLDEIKAIAKAHHDWYTTEDMLLVAQEGIARVHEALQDESLDPDQHKKMSEAFQKYANTWLLLQGKANSINETRRTDNTDIELMELINEQNARNARIEQEERSNNDN